MSFRDPFDVAQQCQQDPEFAAKAGALSRDVFSGDPLFRTCPSCEVETVDEVGLLISYPPGTDAEAFDPTYTCGLVPVELKKKGYIAHIKPYVKRLRARIKERDGEEQAAAFIASAEKLAARIIGLLKDCEFYTGLSQDPTAMHVVRFYAEDGVTAKYIIWHDGREEEPHQQPTEEAQAGVGNPSEAKLECGIYGFTFNHLLCGKEHKKEAEMMAEAKAAGLQGLVYYGTPGVIVLQAQHGDAATYLKACGRVGKKGQQTWCHEEKISESELSSYSPLEPACAAHGRPLEKRGLTPVSLNDIQAVLVGIGHGDRYRQVLGLE